MTQRSTPRLAASPAAINGERVSVRVERVCQILDCDRSQVYRMIATGEVEAHRIGKRGIRVYLDSIGAYQERSQIMPKGKPAARKVVARRALSGASKAAHLAAVESCRKAGLI